MFAEKNDTAEAEGNDSNDVLQEDNQMAPQENEADVNLVLKDLEEEEQSLVDDCFNGVRQ